MSLSSKKINASFSLMASHVYYSHCQRSLEPMCVTMISHSSRLSDESVFVCSWVYLRLDEGKSILWDRTDDNYMKARCAHNLILYNGLEGIRMKGNPNVTVHNNAVLSAKDRVRLIPDGITADDDDPIPNLVLKDNLVHSYFFDGTNKGHAFGTWSNFEDEVISRVQGKLCTFAVVSCIRIMPRCI